MTDPLLTALRGLAEPAPDSPAGSLVDSLADRVVDGWVRAPSTLGDVVVVAGAHGVRLVRPVDWAGGLDAFLEDYRAHHGRPVRPAPAPPDGLLPALQGQGPAPALDLSALTGFARDVLAATATIPPGETRPYGWVAREVGRPRAFRAAASVLARNPVPLLVPCHRVTRGDGSLGKYLFGAEQKASLLTGEGVDLGEFAR